MLSSVCLAQDQPIPVSVVVVEMAPVYDEIPLTGSVTARRVSRISPRVEGFVLEMLADEGDQVEAGASLAGLDPVLAEIGLERVKAQVAEANAELSEARRQRDEASELLKKKHISQTSFESRQAEVKIKSAVLSRLQAELRRQGEILDRHAITAPFSGVLTVKQVEVGQWVDTTTTMFELVEIDVLRIDVPVPQIYFPRVSVGTPVSIRFDAYPQRLFDASVTMKIPSGNASTRTFPIRIEMKNQDMLIAPGMSARVRVRLQASAESKLVSRDALIRKPDGSEAVWLIQEQNKVLNAHSVTVTSGRAFRDKLEIVSSEIEVGDRIVTRGNEILQEGQQVRLVSPIRTE